MKSSKPTDRVIQIGNAYESKRKNSNNGRIYNPDGIAACLHSGSGWKSPLILICEQTE